MEGVCPFSDKNRKDYCVFIRNNGKCNEKDYKQCKLYKLHKIKTLKGGQTQNGKVK